VPLLETPAQIKAGIAALRDAFRAHGRDPSELQVRAVPQFQFRADGKADLEATLAQIPALIEAGATAVEVYACMFCAGPEDFKGFCERLVDFKSRLARS